MTARAARVLAQAKINLGLRVLAREADGYHGIETIFARIELADLVTVAITGGERRLECDAADTGPADQNLAWRAALAFHDATGWPAGFEIKVQKVIPVGAGLGGGSADAGAVLRALNALSPQPLPEVRLLGLAATLGADVPYLTSVHAFAFATGRGEQLLPLEPLPSREVLLIQPALRISTAEAYRWLDADRGDRARRPRRREGWRFESWEAVAPLTQNDFEPVILARHPELSMIVPTLQAFGAPIARLSGSGSAFYAIGPFSPHHASFNVSGSSRLFASHTVTAVSTVEILDARA